MLAGLCAGPALRRHVVSENVVLSNSWHELYSELSHGAETLGPWKESGYLRARGRTTQGTTFTHAKTPKKGDLDCCRKLSRRSGLTANTANLDNAIEVTCTDLLTRKKTRGPTRRRERVRSGGRENLEPTAKMRLKVDKAHSRKWAFAQRYIGDYKGANASTAPESKSAL